MKARSGNVKVGVADRAKVVVQIEEEESVSGGMRRQNIGAEGHGSKRGGHLRPILAVAGTG